MKERDRMKKILVIGKLTNITQTINESLSKRFQVQVCPDMAQVADDMIHMLQPDLVILSTAGWEEPETDIFELFLNAFVDLHVLLVGTDSSHRKFRGYYENPRFQYMESPVTKEQLVERCQKILNVRNSESGKENYADRGEGAQTPVKKHILVVDDSPVLLRSVKVMLEEIYTISLSTSGEQAMKMIGKKRPDLILLDYEMPGCDGRETLELFRGNPDTKDIPVIFFTGVTDREHVMEVLVLKPEGYILKPPNREKMLAEIQAVLGSRNSKAEDSL